MDPSPHAIESATDEADHAAPQYRRDIVTGEWILLAPERRLRPMPTAKVRAPSLVDDREDCPFCPGSEHRTPSEVLAIRPDASPPNHPGWLVRVVPNQYPAVRLSSGGVDESAEPFAQRVAGIGAHEVIIETPDHTPSISGLSDAHIATILRVYQQRINALTETIKPRNISIFKNTGRGAGASQVHAHSQLLATCFLPPRMAAEFAGAERYFQRQRRSVFASLLDRELSERTRLVAAGEQFAAFCPFASRFPGETWILPRRHNPDFTRVTESEIAELAILLRRILTAIESTMDEPAYNYFLHTHPAGEPDTGEYCWHLEITPRGEGIAGFEIGTGMWINPLPPERSAELLRSRLAR